MRSAPTWSGARSDAVAAAALLIESLRALAESLPAAVATVGRLDVSPGAPNVIAEAVTLSVDVRSASPAVLAELIDGVERLAAEAAESRCCAATVELGMRNRPAAMSPPVQQALERAVARAGQPPLTLVSGAGHDAGELALAGVPTGMLFVRSLDAGVSHAPQERSSPEDIACAVTVLADALATLAGGRSV